MSRVTVLNTRPREQAAELSHLLSEAGFEPVEAPAIAVVPAWEPDELARVRQNLDAGAFDWVVLASHNAGQTIAADLQRSAAPIVCGTATALALNLQPTFSLDRFSAAAALEALHDHLVVGQSVLVPRAAEARDELLHGLSTLGARVTAPVAYRTVSAPDAANCLRQGGIDVVALCSPSAVASVASTLGDTVCIVCLGSTTAQAATEKGLRIAGVAPQTSMASLVEAIERVAGAPRA